MTQVALELSIQPSVIEVYIRFKAKAGHFVPRIAFIDTGATVSLFPFYQSQTGWIEI
jgi:5-methylthioribose kinase